jgi:hypothetical protein
MPKRDWTKRDNPDGLPSGDGHRTVEKSEMIMRTGRVVMIEAIDHGWRLTILPACLEEDCLVSWVTYVYFEGSQPTLADETVFFAMTLACSFASIPVLGTVGPS